MDRETPKINRILTMAAIKKAQDEILYESNEDEAAAEYHGELQSVINSLTKPDNEIIKAAEWVCLSSKLLIFEES